MLGEGREVVVDLHVEGVQLLALHRGLARGFAGRTRGRRGRTRRGSRHSATTTARLVGCALSEGVERRLVDVL